MRAAHIPFRRHKRIWLRQPPPPPSAIPSDTYTVAYIYIYDLSYLCFFFFLFFLFVVISVNSSKRRLIMGWLYILRPRDWLSLLLLSAKTVALARVFFGNVCKANEWLVILFSSSLCTECPGPGAFIIIIKQLGPSANLGREGKTTTTARPLLLIKQRVERTKVNFFQVEARV